MPKFLMKWLINSVALYAAVAIVPGIQPQTDNWVSFIWLAAIFGLLNSIVRPILTILSCPLIFLTFGLFLLVINTFLFSLVGQIGQTFQIGFTVDGFMSAFFGAIVVSLVSMILSGLLKDEKKKK